MRGGGNLTFKNRAFAAERLQRDLSFVLQNPVAGAAVAPVADDLFCWHGAVKLADVVYHFELTMEVRVSFRLFLGVGFVEG
jgi:hypothetical protein